MLHLFLNFLFEEIKASFFLFAVANGLTDLLVVFDVTFSQDSLEFIFVLIKFLFISALFIGQMSELLFLLLIFTSASDAGLQDSQKFISSLFFVLGRAKVW